MKCIIHQIEYIECPLQDCLLHIRRDDIHMAFFCPKNEGQIVPRKVYMPLFTTWKVIDCVSTEPTIMEQANIIVPKNCGKLEDSYYWVNY